MIALATLRLSDADEANLRWYWSAAEGALGLRSNFEAVIQAAIPSRNKGTKPLGPAKPPSIAWEAIEAVAEVRAIERQLTAVGRTHRRTLAAAYGPGLPRQADETWRWLASGDLTAALMLVTAERLEIGRRTLTAWREANKDKKGRMRPRHGSLLRLLYDEADTALTLACQAYNGEV